MDKIIRAIEKFGEVPTEDKPEYMLDQMAPARQESDTKPYLITVDPVKEAEPKPAGNVPDLLEKIERNTRKVTTPYILSESFTLEASDNIQTFVIRSRFPVKYVKVNAVVQNGAYLSPQHSITVLEPYHFTTYYGQGFVGNNTYFIGGNVAGPGIELPYKATVFQLQMLTNAASTPIPVTFYMYNDESD